MQKHGINAVVYTLIAAAFSSFFRWIQNQAAFEADTGLMIEGAIWSKLALVVCLIGIGGIVYLVRSLWYKNYYPAQTYDQIIHGDPVWLERITKGIGAVMVLGAAVNLFIGSYSVYRNLQGVLSVLGIVTAWAFVQMSRLPQAEKQSPMRHSLLASIPVVFYLDWLTVSYRTNGANPSVWAYAPEIIAIGMCIAGMFYFAGYGWDFPRPYAAVGCLMAGAMLSLTTLMDARNVGQQLMLIAGGAMQLYYVWMIITSMSEIWPEEAEQAPEAPRQETT